MSGVSGCHLLEDSQGRRATEARYRKPQEQEGVCPGRRGSAPAGSALSRLKQRCGGPPSCHGKAQVLPRVEAEAPKAKRAGRVLSGLRGPRPGHYEPPNPQLQGSIWPSP